MPNILGSLEIGHSAQKAWINSNPGVTGAIYRITNSTAKKKNYANGSDSGYLDWGFGINASTSNPIYGSSETVQPLSLTAIFCIKYSYLSRKYLNG